MQANSANVAAARLVSKQLTIKVGYRGRKRDTKQLTMNSGYIKVGYRGRKRGRESREGWMDGEENKTERKEKG